MDIRRLQDPDLRLPCHLMSINLSLLTESNTLTLTILVCSMRTHTSTLPLTFIQLAVTWISGELVPTTICS